MPIRQVTVSGFPAVALRAAELEAVVVPTLGMKISNLRRTRGREWLWRNPRMPFAEPVPGTSYVERADSGGWDECFPTVGPSTVPGDPAAPALPDHGELWSAHWTSSVFERDRAPTLAAFAAGTRFPYEFHREISLDPAEPVMRVRYHVRHTGGAPFPWIWSSHPLLNVQPGSVLELPGVSQVRVDAAHGRPDLEIDDHVSWAGGIGGRAERFEFPAAEKGGWAAKLFADSSGSAMLTDPVRGERLEFRAAPAEVPQIGVWINAAGWAPGGALPYYNLALEPCIGAPDRLDRAAVDWNLAHMLSEGEERRWSLEVRLWEDGD
jgi:galactose mutarotase-like enzyme